jgi:hypothetical protein
MEKIPQANPELRRLVKVFLDVILIHSSTPALHHQHLECVLSILQEFGMRVELKKCQFFCKSLEFLGFQVNQDGVHVLRSKAAAIRDWGTPLTVPTVKSFLELVEYYRKFIPGFADIAHPLYSAAAAMTLQWTSRCQHSFQCLKEAISRTLVLAIPTHDGEYDVRTDASQLAIGAVLMQRQPIGGPRSATTNERTVVFYSRQLSPTQRNYRAYDRELLAVEKAILHWRYYLQQASFLVYTDHQSIQHLFSQHLTHRQMSYFATILGYDFTSKYWPGSKNEIADAPSRRYEEVKLESAAVLLHVSVSTMGIKPGQQTKREMWLQRKRGRRVKYALRPHATEVGVSCLVALPALLHTEAVLQRIGGLVEELVNGYLEDG